jgi:hypothetical protein
MTVEGEPEPMYIQDIVTVELFWRKLCAEKDARIQELEAALLALWNNPGSIEAQENARKILR